MNTNRITLPIITYSEVEQLVKDWISTGCSEYLQHVPKNELLAHCWMVGVEKQVIKKAYCSNGKDELIKALISNCPIVGSSRTMTEDLQAFLNRSSDLYSVIHAQGRVDSVRQMDTQLAHGNHHQEQHAIRNNTAIFLEPLHCPKPKQDSMVDEINSPELSIRPRRKIRTSPKDKYRLKEYKKRLVKTTGGNETK